VKKSHVSWRRKNLRLRNLFAFYFLLLTVVFSTGVVANESENQLDKFLEGLETLTASFEQTLLNEYGEELDKSLGVVQLRRPGMFHWQYLEPYAQTLISDGSILWVYDEDLEQLTIRDISNIIEDSPAAILGGDIDIDAHYIVIDVEGSEDIDWLELTPRDVESQYSAIRLGFRDGQLLSMILFDNLGQTTQIKLLDIKRNLPMDIGLFQFTAPEGVDVIDSREP
jgi:outer membrane lipoprotein carrier protein